MTTPSPFAGLSDAQLLRQLGIVANQCVAVMELPVEERRRPGPKGEASPEQAGAMSAAFVLQMVAECERRGIA